MEGSEPASVQLNLEEAFEFLKESAWILEDAGFKVIIPAWLTPKGRRRAKVPFAFGWQKQIGIGQCASLFFHGHADRLPLRAGHRRLDTDP